MNKFEQEVQDVMQQELSIVYSGETQNIENIEEASSLISTLHDNEMIAFAEWCANSVFKYLKKEK